MDKRYKFALFGLSGSGKTCYFTALDESTSREHPKKYICTRIRHNDDYIKKMVQTLAPKEKQKMEQRLLKGDDTICIAAANLSKQILPKATREKISIVYQLKTPELGIQYVEIDDYSGELLDLPEDHEEGIAFRKEVASSDGIIILVETPFEKTEHLTYEKYNQLVSLLLQEKNVIGKIEIPVVLLFSKFDRVSGLNFETLDTNKAEKELDKLINGYKDTHRIMYDAIKELINQISHSSPYIKVNTDGQKEKYMPAFKMMPISSFGNSKKVYNSQGVYVEMPVNVNPLLTFSLQDPFVWLIKAKKKIEIQNQIQENQSAESSTPTLRQKNDDLLRQITEITKYDLNEANLSDDFLVTKNDLSELEKSYKELRNKTFLKDTYQSIIKLFIMVLTIITIVGFIHVKIRKTNIEHWVSQKNQLEYELIQNDLEWLNEYITPNDKMTQLYYLLPKIFYYLESKAKTDKDILYDKIDREKKCNEYIENKNILACYELIKNDSNLRNQFKVTAYMIDELNFFYQKDSCSEISDRYDQINKNVELSKMFQSYAELLQQIDMLCQQKQDYLNINDHIEASNDYLNKYIEMANTTPYYQDIIKWQGFKTKSCEKLINVDANIILNDILVTSKSKKNIHTQVSMSAFKLKGNSKNQPIGQNVEIPLIQSKENLFSRNLKTQMNDQLLKINIDSKIELQLKDQIQINLKIVEDNWIQDVDLYKNTISLSCNDLLKNISANDQWTSIQIDPQNQDLSMKLNFQLKFKDYLDTLPKWDVKSPLVKEIQDGLNQ
jgi:hypothetical protein